VIQDRFKAIGEWAKRHEKRLSSAALLFGFILDNITLQRIDIWFGNALLFFYIVLTGVCIALINLYDSGKWRTTLSERVFPWLPIILQFAFGNLLSGYFVYYLRSASLASSWPFIALMLGLLLANERFRDRYLKFTFQVTIYYIIIFGYLIFFMPMVFNSIAAWVFVVSGALSLLAIGGVVYGIYRIIPWRVKKSLRAVVFSVVGIYSAVGVMYVMNIIPPIPLALKDAGVYHRVEKNASGEYLLTGELTQWYDLYGHYRPTIHWTPGESVYFFSSVFSPTKLNTTIVHQWYYFDNRVDEWVASSRIEYPIFGGRGGGYRGYSTKESVFPGAWRVDVMTLRGQVLGRQVFNIVEGGVPTVLDTVVHK
jgi:hypothetical protein